MKHKRKRGFAMQYAIVLILLVSLLVGIVLMSAQISTTGSKLYENYIDRKIDLDKIGSMAIVYFCDGKTDDSHNPWVLSEKLGYSIGKLTLKNTDDSENTDATKNTKEVTQVYIYRNSKVYLYLEFETFTVTEGSTEETNGGSNETVTVLKTVLTKYNYNYGTLPQELLPEEKPDEPEEIEEIEEIEGTNGTEETEKTD